MSGEDKKKEQQAKLKEINDAMDDALKAARIHRKQNENFYKETLETNENIKEFEKQKHEIVEFINSNKKNPLIREYILLYESAEKNKETLIGRMSKSMREAALLQHELEYAMKVCTNDQAKKRIKERYDKISREPAMNNYGKFIEGLKYYAGMTHDVSKDVKEFFKKDLRLPFLDVGTDRDNVYETYRDNNNENAKKAEQIEEYGQEKFKLIEQYQKKVAKAKARELFTRQQEHFYGLDVQFFGRPFDDLLPKIHSIRVLFQDD